MLHIGDIKTPDFSPYTRIPNSINCKKLDTKRIVAEILWWERPASKEVLWSFNWEQVTIDWQYAIVLRYRRERDGKSYPAVVMWYDIWDQNNEVIIRHIQKIPQKKIAYRFNSGFDCFSYFWNFMKQNFTDNGMKISMPIIPIWLDGCDHHSQLYVNYDQLRQKIEILNSTL